MLPKRFFNNKKGISVIITVIFLMGILIIATMVYQEWNFKSINNFLSNIEEKSSIDFIVKGIYNNILYIKSSSKFNITNIKIENVNCNITNITINKGINEIDVSSCLNNITTNTPEIVIISDKITYQKKILIDKHRNYFLS